MADVIVTIPGATNITVDDAPSSAVVVIFPASNNVVTTVIDRGILFGVQGAQGQTGGVNTINGQSGNVTLTTSEIPENPSALYFTNTRVRDAVLTGLSTATNAIISATDSVLSAFGKLQAQINVVVASLIAHISNTSNPHNVTQAQVGLGNVDNTSDANKPISTATQTALNGKENTITAGTTSQYYRGDKTFQTLDKTAVGLGNVANVDTTNASNISSGTLSDSRLSANVTTQGNTFNTANKLVQLDASAKLPAVDGSNLTNLNIPPSTGGDLYLFYNY